MKISYKIYNKKFNLPVDCHIDEKYPQFTDTFVTPDGRVGFVDTVGLFHEQEEWEVREVKIDETN